MSEWISSGLFSRSDRAKDARLWIVSLAVFAVLLFLIFQEALSVMVASWSSAEYSHGYLIPVIALFFLWRDRHLLAAARQGGSWSGALVVVIGLAMALMGNLGTIYAVVQYAFLVTLFGVALTFFGWKAMRFLWVPLLYLVFMIPLPQFLYSGLSGEMQLIASQVGVAVIRWFGISVFLEGNVIDLGVFKLHVVEACSGLRYLFPLMSFGFLVANLYHGPLWHKVVFFLSTIPITIFMNSFRIGIIGVLVEHYGIEMAEGFLHTFEGWFIFMACLAILFAEVWLLMRFSRMRGSLIDRFRMDTRPRPADAGSTITKRSLPLPYLAALAIVVFATASISFLGERAEATLERQAFTTFPMRLENWRGKELALEPDIVETLQFEDYILADYKREADPANVNFYVAYYGSQRNGEAVHSPQACITGGGWQIESFGQNRLNAIDAGGQQLNVNRAIIAKGDLKQLVYYWFPQRDRFITNQYQVKWYIFWDALTRNRTDGALVRLVTPIIGDDGYDDADRRLSEFATTIFPNLEAYLPS